MAAALADLHQQHVLHLDLKPANIMFRPTGEAVLIDFGLSRHEQLPDLLEEQFHRPTGTPDYMAPEQLFRVRSDKRSDIYAFGAVLYQLATGQLPFGGRRACKRCAGASGATRFRLAPAPEIPPVLQEIILRCLEPLPDARYRAPRTCSSILRHLDLVELTERAERHAAERLKTVLGRRLRAAIHERDPGERDQATAPPANHPGGG